MLFLLSKLLYVLILPLTWVFALLIWGVLAKNYKKKQKILFFAIGVMWFFGNKFTLRVIEGVWNVRGESLAGKTYSAEILLGGFVSEGKKGKGHFNEASDRFTAAVELLEKGTVRHILFTGGNASIYANEFSEAPYVKLELNKLNIADSLILLDGKAANTAQNAANSKRILDNTTLKPPYVLVTSAFHMRRAMLIFKKEGLDVVPCPSDYRTEEDIMPTDFVPEAGAFGRWSVYIKEMVGYVVALIK